MDTPRPLRDFMPLVLPYVAGCPIPVAEQAVRMSAIEWCERTKCWRSVIKVNIEDPVKTLVAPMWAAIHEIENATFGDSDRPLQPVQYSQMSASDIEADEPQSGAPEYITQASPNHVTLIPFTTGRLRLSLFLKPRSGPDFDQAQNLLPEHIFTQDAEVIAQGALHRLFAMPGKPWTSAKHAAFYFSRFDERANAKFSSELRGQHRARVRSRPHWL